MVDPNVESSPSEAIENTEEVSSKVPLWNRFADILSFDLLVSNIPFMLFVAGLGAIYITNNSKAAELVRELDKKQRELKELKWEYSDLHARLLYHSSESQLTKRFKDNTLQPLDKPAFEIKNRVIIKEKK